MFGNLMDKLNNAQTDMAQRLEFVLVDGQAEDGMVKVVSYGNKVIKQVLIDQKLIDEGDKEAVEELVLVAVNRALEKADEVHREEMKKIAGDMLPDISGMF